MLSESTLYRLKVNALENTLFIEIRMVDSIFQKLKKTKNITALTAVMYVYDK